MSFLVASAAVVMLAVSGAAIAQTYEGPLPPNDRVGMPAAQMYQGPLPAFLVGKNLHGQRNDYVGEILGVRDHELIVSIGHYLGQGERIVLIPREKIYFTGSGDTTQIGTTMGKADLEALPTYMGVIQEKPVVDGSSSKP